MLRKVLYTVCGVSVGAVVLSLLHGTGLLPGGLIGYAWLISLFFIDQQESLFKDMAVICNV